MEEVDKIILLQLKALGTEDIEIASLKELSTEAFVEGCARCINAINANDELPLKLPGSMSARFRVGTQLAQACQAVGYGSDIGYNSFLYSNESSARQLLMWLVERLPKESGRAAEESLGSAALFNRAVTECLADRLTLTWIPPVMFKDGICWRSGHKAWIVVGQRSVSHFRPAALFVPLASMSPAAKDHAKSLLPLVTAQPPSRRDVLSSILAANAAGLAAKQAWELEWSTIGIKSGLDEAAYRKQKQAKVKASIAEKLRVAIVRGEAERRKNVDMAEFLGGFAGVDFGKASLFRNKEKLQFAKETDVTEQPKAATEEELKQQREAEVVTLQAQLDELNARLQELAAESKQFSKGAGQLQARAEALLAHNSELEEAMKVRKRVLDLLPNADENMAKLQEAIDNAAGKLVALAEKWEVHRVALIDEYRKLKSASSDVESGTKEQIEEMAKMREEMKELAETAKDKDAAVQQLQASFEKLNKEITRTWYTSRIQEIVKSISKQKDEIAKVLIDMRVLQKDISNLADKLGRTFTVTDELIFKDARKDDDVRKCYRFLANLHEACNSLIEMVEASGAVQRSVRDLEDQIELEKAKNMAANLERITNDYTAIKTENKTLSGK